MSKARMINDYYATVFLHRYHKDNRPSQASAQRSLFGLSLLSAHPQSTVKASMVVATVRFYARGVKLSRCCI
jgi:hypothetical protein